MRGVAEAHQVVPLLGFHLARLGEGVTVSLGLLNIRVLYQEKSQEHGQMDNGNTQAIVQSCCLIDEVLFDPYDSVSPGWSVFGGLQVAAHDVLVLVGIPIL